MGTDPMAMAQHLRNQLSAAADDRPDGELLAAFAATKGEAEFAVLLARHGPMVLGVCRRLLGNAADAEDAFQAVFLVLVRRAAGLSGARLGLRMALRGRVPGGDEGPDPGRSPAGPRTKGRSHATNRNLRAPRRGRLGGHPPLVLDEELDRLGTRYRDPVVLCLLEGRSREEAARLLGWPLGTVNGRLSRAKELLRERLARRGVLCTTAGLGALLSARGATAVPAELARTTLATVVGTAPAAVAGLAAGAAPARWGGRAVAIFGLVVAGGLVAFAVWVPSEPNPIPANPPRAPEAPAPAAPRPGWPTAPRCWRSRFRPAGS